MCGPRRFVLLQGLWLLRRLEACTACDSYKWNPSLPKTAQTASHVLDFAQTTRVPSLLALSCFDRWAAWEFIWDRRGNRGNEFSTNSYYT